MLNGQRTHTPTASSTMSMVACSRDMAERAAKIEGHSIMDLKYALVAVEDASDAKTKLINKLRAQQKRLTDKVEEQKASIMELVAREQKLLERCQFRKVKRAHVSVFGGYQLAAKKGVGACRWKLHSSYGCR